jgi:hypothetical protein
MGMAGRELVVEQQQESGVPYYVKTEFEIVRKGSVKWYIYAMASVPLVFAVIILNAFFVVEGTGKDDKTRLPIFEALAVTLAVLPLRLVLVPPEILELTRVDLILGFAITFTLFLLSAKYAFNLRIRHRNTPHGRDHSHVHPQPHPPPTLPKAISHVPDA